MSVIVQNGTEHVEQKRRVLHGNTMSCRHRSMVRSMENPPHPSPDCNPEEDIYSDADSDAWHDDVSHIMHMLPCSAYF